MSRIHKLTAPLPTADERLRDLKEEHPAFVRTVDSVIHRAERSTAEALQSLREEVGGLIEELHRHEEAEGDLIQKAHCRDEGA